MDKGIGLKSYRKQYHSKYTNKSLQYMVNLLDGLMAGPCVDALVTDVSMAPQTGLFMRSN